MPEKPSYHELEKRVQELEQEVAEFRRAENERKDAEKQLIQSENRFRSILEDISNIAVQGYDEARRVTFWNQASEQVYGYTRQEALGRKLEDLIIPPWMQDEVKRLHQRWIAQGEAIPDSELELMDKDGNPVPVFSSHTLQETINGKELFCLDVDLTPVKQIEQALKESEAKFRSVVEHAQESIVVLLDGNILFSNPKTREILGCSAKELAERSFLDFIHPDDRDWLFEQYLKKIAGETVPIDQQYRVLDEVGRTRWVQSRSKLIEWEHRPALLTSLFDVTEMKHTEQQLQEREKQFRQIFEGSRDGFVMVNTAQHIINANPAFCEMLGYSLAELRAMDSFYHITPECWQQWEEEEIWQKRLLQQGYSGIYEKEYIRRDGTVFPVELQSYAVFDAEGAVLYLWGVARDITERRKAEEALRESEGRLQGIVQASPDPLVVYDAAGRTQYVNPAFTDVFGWTLEELLGDRIPFIPEDCVLETSATFEAMIRSGKTGQMQTKRLTKQGDPIDVLISAAPIPGPEGKSPGLVVNLTDMREQRELESRFQQAQKMESVGRLAGGVAHDFNNMLGAISGHAELALMQTDISNPVYTDLQEIVKAAQRSADLTRQLLAFARRQPAEPKVLDLNAAVSGMLKMLRRLIGEEIELVWKPGEEVWKIRMDPAQVDQILANLCVNARDAIPGVGTIVMETRNVILDESYCLGHPGFQPGQYAMLSVSDTGTGMDREVLDKIFEPFFTTKKMGEGTGLGLATVYGIVKQNSAFINAYSEPGQGTTFTIYFPGHNQAVDTQEKTDGPAPRSGTETVLVVEDDPSILAVSREVLEQSGYTVLAAHSPSAAFQLAEDQPGPIHLLLTDVVLSEMNGKVLWGELKQSNPDLKVLYMSGYTPDVIMHRGILEKDVNFIQKPFSINALTEKVRQVLDTGQPDLKR